MAESMKTLYLHCAVVCRVQIIPRFLRDDRYSNVRSCGQQGYASPMVQLHLVSRMVCNVSDNLVFAGTRTTSLLKNEDSYVD